MTLRVNSWSPRQYLGGVNVMVRPDSHLTFVPHVLLHHTKYMLTTPSGSWRIGSLIRSGVSCWPTISSRPSLVSGCSWRAGASTWPESTTGSVSLWTTRTARWPRGLSTSPGGISSPRQDQKQPCWVLEWPWLFFISLLTWPTPCSLLPGRSSPTSPRSTSSTTGLCPGSAGGAPGLSEEVRVGLAPSSTPGCTVWCTSTTSSPPGGPAFRNISAGNDISQPCRWSSSYWYSSTRFR